MMIRRGKETTTVYFAFNQYRRIREGVWKAMWLADVAGVAKRGRKKHK
jgi:hypothetical protein